MAIRIATGCPLWNVTFEEADQPPITASSNAIHVAADQQTPPNRNLRRESRRHTIRGVVGAKGSLILELIQRLRTAHAVPSHPAIVAGGNIVRVSRERVAALERKILAAALFESKLHRVVAGVRAEIREAVEFAIELRIGTQQIQQRNRWIVVAGIRFIEDGVRSDEQRLKRIRHRAVQLIRGVILRDGRRNEIPVPRTRAVAALGKMRAAVRRIVDADHDVARQQPLDSGAPLVDLRIPIGLVAEIARSC